MNGCVLAPFRQELGYLLREKVLEVASAFIWSDVKGACR